MLKSCTFSTKHVPVQGRLGERAHRQLRPDVEPRQQRRRHQRAAQAGGGHRHQKIPLPAAGGDARGDAFAFAGGEDLGIEGKAGLEQDEG